MRCMAMRWGLFPVNILHTLTHLMFGVWGLIASRNADSARTYARVTAAAAVILRTV